MTGDEHETDRDAPIDEPKTTVRPKKRKRRDSILTNQELKILTLRIGPFGTKPPEWNDDVFVGALFAAMRTRGAEDAVPLVPVFLRTNAPEEAKKEIRAWILDPLSSVAHCANRASDAIAGVAAGSFHVLVLRESDRFANAANVAGAIGREPTKEEIENAKRDVASQVSRLAARIAERAGLDSSPVAIDHSFDIGNALPKEGEEERLAREREIEEYERENPIPDDEPEDVILTAELTDGLRARLAKMLASINADDPWAGDDQKRNAWIDRHAEADRDGMLELDAILWETIREIGGDNAKRIADEQERDSRVRWEMRNDSSFAFSEGDPTNRGALWKRWVNPIDAEGCGFPFIGLLAEAAWLGIIRPKLERESRVRPALAYQIHEDVSRIHSRTHTLETRNGQQHLRFDGHSPIAIVPSVEDDALGRIAESIVRGVSLLGNITAHKALQWEVFTGYRQAIEGAADARVLLVEGGWSTFARDVLDLSAKSDIENVRDIVRAQSAIRLSLPDGSFGNLLALREMEARGRRRGWIEIVLGTMLMPHYVHELDGKLSGRTASESKRLVPMVGLPPFVGSRTEHGAQATLSMHVVRELRTRAPELVTDGGVLIDAGRFASLAMSSGVKASNVHRVIDRWTQDGTDAPAFLRRVGHSRYTLGDAHAPARSFLETAGKMTIDASAAGRKSIEAKAKARTGLRRRGKRAAE